MEEIFQTYLAASTAELKGAAVELKEMTPAAMNSMLEKELKSDAVKRKDERNKKMVENVPPTTPGKKPHPFFHCQEDKLAKEAELFSCYQLNTTHFAFGGNSDYMLYSRSK